MLRAQCCLRPVRHYGLALVVTSIFCASFWLYSSNRAPPIFTSHQSTPELAYHQYESLANQSVTTNNSDRHAIDELIAASRQSHKEILALQSPDVETAVLRYREHRGRHPPPGFDEWMRYALKSDAVVVEQFFDRIYHDIRPFWGLDAEEFALSASSWEHLVRVRHGRAELVGNTSDNEEWLKTWTGLVSEVALHLPDVDMPVNLMAQPHALVPADTIDRYNQLEASGRALLPERGMHMAYSGLAGLDSLREEGLSEPFLATSNSSIEASFWDFVRLACPSNLPARDMLPIKNFSTPPTVPSQWEPAFTHKGFIENFTAASGTSLQPHLRGLHGAFIEPLSIDIMQELVPLFGGSKLSVNNEILIPNAMDLASDGLFRTNRGPAWEEKRDVVVWRGSTSVLRSTEDSWPRFHRHRLVEMLNGTTVSCIERSAGRAGSFAMAPAETFNYLRRREGTVGQWLNKNADAGFVDLRCRTSSNETFDHCPYLAQDFSRVGRMPVAEQLKWKFILDVGGDSSSSGRFRALLLSTSLPLKATLFVEWHDARLMPLVHFAPIDNTFRDLHAVLDYFASDARGDAAARLIADEGRSWAQKVLRRDDMLLYV